MNTPTRDRDRHHDVRVPALPESVSDATVAAWHKAPGERVTAGESLVDLETDKVMLEVPAPTDGVLLDILAPAGVSVRADAVLARIGPAAPETASVPAPAAGQAASAPAATGFQPPDPEPHAAPAARRLLRELNLDPRAIQGTGKGGRIQKADVMRYLDAREEAEPVQDPDTLQWTESWSEPGAPEPALGGEPGRPEQRVPMTRLRARIAERLVQAQRQAAMLTTFNEVDLGAIMRLRKEYRDPFEAQHGVRLGLMSFFVKVTVEALKRFPVLNASIDGEEILYHGYYDIGIAVSSPRGLVVPILRNCDRLSMAEIEQGILDFTRKAGDGTLSYEELTGGTFTITNGGVFGSLLSTPILNPPQSAILGLHRIQERPIADRGEIRIAPMMYLALTYDHRLIDGREAVLFLNVMREMLEDPARLLLGV